MEHKLPEWLTTEQLPPNSTPLASSKLLILVGVTGVGKSTTVDAIAAAGLSFRLLPNRRDLTDWLIFPAVQQADRLPQQPIHDRQERFAATRRYRELHAGGMAFALTKLSLIQEQAGQNEWLIFDGLRGENEVAHAAELLPNARFLVLDAPHGVRLQRLLGRGDLFDQVAVSAAVESDSTLRQDVMAEAEGLLQLDEIEQLLALVALGEVSAENLRAKLRIVSAERANYDPLAAIAKLQAIAPDRTHLYDTASLSPQEIASNLVTALNDT